VVKSTSTGLLAILAGALLISISSPSIHAQTTRPVGQSAALPQRGGAEMDAVTLRAVMASWKKVKLTIDKGKPVNEPIPVYIISRFEEDPLSEEQQRDVIARARKADLWRELWFITVSSNFDGRYTARVYFKPDIEQGHFRQGKMITCSNWIKEQASPGRWPPLRGMLVDYVQCSAEPPECFQPDGQNMPFPIPAGFSLEEVAEIIQFIHTPNRVSPKADMTRAILGIHRKGDNVEVEMGVREGPYSGRGGTWKCKKTNGVWAVVDTAEWVN
jgi:hypothetical protein